MVTDFISTLLISFASVYATQPSTPVAGNGYNFDISYSGNIIQNEDKKQLYLGNIDETTGNELIEIIKKKHTMYVSFFMHSHNLT